MHKTHRALAFKVHKGSNKIGIASKFTVMLLITDRPNGFIPTYRPTAII